MFYKHRFISSPQDFDSDSLLYLSTYLFTYLFIRPPIHSFVRSFIRPCVRASVRSFIRLFAHSFIYCTLIHSFIVQEPISRVVEGQIVADFRSSLSDVCDVLSSLDIAIGFLASSGGQKERTLKSYLHEVLKLPGERGLKSPTVSKVK